MQPSASGTLARINYQACSFIEIYTPKIATRPKAMHSNVVLSRGCAGSELVLRSKFTKIMAHRVSNYSGH